MESRINKVTISAAGGTAAQGSKTCKVTIPNAWLEQLGVTSEDREVVLSFDGESVTLLVQQSSTKHMVKAPFAPTMKQGLLLQFVFEIRKQDFLIPTPFKMVF